MILEESTIIIPPFLPYKDDLSKSRTVRKLCVQPSLKVDQPAGEEIWKSPRLSSQSCLYKLLVFHKEKKAMLAFFDQRWSSQHGRKFGRVQDCSLCCVCAWLLVFYKEEKACWQVWPQLVCYAVKCPSRMRKQQEQGKKSYKYILTAVSTWRAIVQVVYCIVYVLKTLWIGQSKQVSEALITDLWKRKICLHTKNLEIFC